MTIHVVHYGLGPIGVEVGRLVTARTELTSVGAVEVDPRRLGATLAEVIGAPAPEQIRVVERLPAPQPDRACVVLHCTGSSLERVLPQLLECVGAGYHVVSTCEELSHPWRTQPELATRLDRAAAAHGVSVLGTGVNPGYAMDYLPVTLTGACHAVDHVSVRRVQDAGARRLPLRRKVGAGLTVGEFAEAATAGTVRHVGLTESVWAIAEAVGWRVREITETLEPILAPAELFTPAGTIPAGAVAGIRQHCRGLDPSGERVALTLEMAVGLDHPRDEIHISGVPDLRLEVPGGLPGDVATAAVVVNSVGNLVAAPPGLRTMTELPPPRGTG